MKTSWPRRTTWPLLVVIACALGAGGAAVAGRSGTARQTIVVGPQRASAAPARAWVALTYSHTYEKELTAVQVLNAGDSPTRIEVWSHTDAGNRHRDCSGTYSPRETMRCAPREGWLQVLSRQPVVVTGFFLYRYGGTAPFNQTLSPLQLDWYPVCLEERKRCVPGRP